MADHGGNVLSSNYTLGVSAPRDPGVAAYFTLRGKSYAIPCDRWSKIEHNVQAIALTVEAMRGMDRWGAKNMIEAMFSGFKALPTTKEDRLWWEVLGVNRLVNYEDALTAYPATAKHFAPVGPDGKSQIAAYWQSPFEFEKGPFGIKCEPQVAEHLKPQEWCVSVYVHGIAGYCAEKEVVAERQASLLSWGFEIMRSPRGEDGRYWEVFYLPGVWKLQGDLKGKNLTQTLKAVAGLGVGSIDLVTQRAALVVED